MGLPALAAEESVNLVSSWYINLVLLWYIICRCRGRSWNETDDERSPEDYAPRPVEEGCGVAGLQEFG